MVKSRPFILGVISGFALLLVLSFSSLASSTAVIDFEGIPEGTIVSQLDKDYGISGDPISGFVGIHGLNPDFGQAVNTAMIFDATCQPGGLPVNCSGNDRDLYHPAWGNTLIISEDLDSSDPDDADVPGAVFHFDFRNWGSGAATVESIDVQDVELEELEDAKIELFANDIGGTLLKVVDIPETGNGNFTTIHINVANVGTMLIDLQGSGEIDNIKISTEPTAVQLLSFDVHAKDGKDVILEWETAAEIDNYGFYLYRGAEMQLAKATQIHFEAAGGGNGGHTYSYTDRQPGLGTWYYWLADVDTHGVKTFHGPVAVVLNGTTPVQQDHQIFMPISILQTR